jgi:hypothetical protein
VFVVVRRVVQVDVGVGEEASKDVDETRILIDLWNRWMCSERM